jgi:hypothetical protein
LNIGILVLKVENDKKTLGMIRGCAHGCVELLVVIGWNLTPGTVLIERRMDGFELEQCGDARSGMGDFADWVTIAKEIT